MSITTDYLVTLEDALRHKQARATARYKTAWSDQPDETLCFSDEKPWLEALEQIERWVRNNSSWAIHFNSAWGNGDIEILATLTSRYNPERFGLEVQDGPQHAEVLICSGPVTEQRRERLLHIYGQMLAPKFVVAVGTDEEGAGRSDIVGHIDEAIPVDVYAPGWPPEPKAVIEGVIKLLESLKKQSSEETWLR